MTSYYIQKGDNIDATALTNLQDKLEAHYSMCEDFHLSAEKINFQAEGHSRNDWENYFLKLQIDGKPDGRKVFFTQDSWKQFCRKIKMPSGVIEKLKEAPSLISQFVDYFLRKTSSSYLARIIGEGDKSFLRGLLDERYTRLDNYMIVQALLDPESQRQLQEAGLELKKNLWASEELYLHYVNKKEKMTLTRVNDECFSGISIVNSDVGNKRGVVVGLYYERLVCLNGMTQSRKVADYVIKKLPAAFHSRYRNKKPDWKLPADIFERIRSLLMSGILQQYAKAKNEGKVLKLEMEELLKVSLDMKSETEIKKTIAALIKLAGIRVLRGVSINEIYLAYLEEIRDFQDTEKTAYALYNAITRYASQRLTMQPDEDAERWNLPARDMTIMESLDLSHRIIRRTGRISSRNFDWQRVREDAQKITVVESPHI